MKRSAAGEAVGDADLPLPLPWSAACPSTKLALKYVLKLPPRQKLIQNGFQKNFDKTYTHTSPTSPKIEARA